MIRKLMDLESFDDSIIGENVMYKNLTCTIVSYHIFSEFRFNDIKDKTVLFIIRHKDVDYGVARSCSDD